MNLSKSLALIIFLFSFKSIKSITESETSLVLVQTMFRHGVRSLLLKYPNNTKDVWDKYGGLGVLTKVGMRQLYDYAIFFRNKYKNFLSPVYDKSKMFARSTDYDRTLQSCYTFLSGLYQPDSNQKWTDKSEISGWYPIPVHTTNLSTDNILHANADCPRYEELRKEMRSTKEYLSLQSSNQNFINNMTAFSGLNNLNYYMIWQIADKAMVEEAHNMTLDQYIIDNYNKIMEINDYTFYIDFVTDEMGKLISGGLLNDIVKNINNKVNKSITNELFIYGVHDNYVAGMQKILNTSAKFVQPNFASGFVFELRNDTKSNYYVQVLYKNNKYPAPDELVPVIVYGCEQLCPLNNFLKIVNDKLVTDFNIVCKSKNSSIGSLIMNRVIKFYLGLKVFILASFSISLLKLF